MCMCDRVNTRMFVDSKGSTSPSIERELNSTRHLCSQTYNYTESNSKVRRGSSVLDLEHLRFLRLRAHESLLTRKDRGSPTYQASPVRGNRGREIDGGTHGGDLFPPISNPRSVRDSRSRITAREDDRGK